MARKEFLKKLEKGQILSARIEEVLSSTEAICDFHGDLLRVSNQTGADLKQGEQIRLRITSTEPLEFQTFDTRNIKFDRMA